MGELDPLALDNGQHDDGTCSSTLSSSCARDIEEVTKEAANALVKYPSAGPNSNLSHWVLPEVCNKISSSLRSNFPSSCNPYFGEGSVPYFVGNGVPFTNYNNTNTGGSCIDNPQGSCTMNSTFWATANIVLPLEKERKLGSHMNYFNYARDVFPNVLVPNTASWKMADCLLMIA